MLQLSCLTEFILLIADGVGLAVGRQSFLNLLARVLFGDLKSPACHPEKSAGRGEELVG